MKAQQITRTENISGAGVPGVYISPNAIDTRGQQAQARGNANLAGALYEWGRDVQLSISSDRVTDSLLKAEKDITDLELKYSKDPDHRTIPQRFHDDLNDVREKYKSEIALDPRAKKSFEKRFTELRQDREKRMAYKVDAREIDFQKGNLVNNLNERLRFIENLDIDDMPEYRRQLEEVKTVLGQKAGNEIISFEKAAYLNQAFKERSDIIRAMSGIKHNAYETYDRLNRDTWREYFPYMSDEKHYELLGKAGARIKDIEGAIDAENKQRKAAEKKARDREIEGIKNDFLKRILFPIQSGGPLSSIEILDSNLPEKDKEHFVKVLEDKADAVLKGVDSEYDKTNKRLYGTLKEMIYREPEKIKSINQLWEYHGKGLSTADVSELSKLWEARAKPEKDDTNVSLKRAITALKGLHTQGFFGDKATKESWQKLNEASKAVELYVADHPKADDKEIMGYVDQITSEEGQSFLGEVWRNLDSIGRSLFTPHLWFDFGLTTPSEEEQNKRERAIEILQRNNKVVNEQTIKSVMEQLK